MHPVWLHRGFLATRSRQDATRMKLRAGRIALWSGDVILLLALNLYSNPNCVISCMAQCNTKHFVFFQVSPCLDSWLCLYRPLRELTDIDSSCSTCVHRSKKVFWFMWAGISWFSAKLSAGSTDGKGTSDGKIGVATLLD